MSEIDTEERLIIKLTGYQASKIITDYLCDFVDKKGYSFIQRLYGPEEVMESWPDTEWVATKEIKKGAKK